MSFPKDYQEKRSKGVTEIPGIVLYQLHSNDLDFGGNMIEISSPYTYPRFIVNRHFTQYIGGDCLGLYSFFAKRKSGFNIEYWYPDLKQYGDYEKFGFSMSKIYFDTLDNIRQYYNFSIGAMIPYLDISHRPFMSHDVSEIKRLINNGKPEILGADAEYVLSRVYMNANGRYILIPEDTASILQPRGFSHPLQK